MNNQSIEPIVLNASYNINFFNYWVKQCLIKKLKLKQEVILDHVSLLLHLNPIKKFWATIKRYTNRNIVQCIALYKALLPFFKIPLSS
ncbi:hypothetical protein HCUR_00691 [Holospora curviuscula]|uniref:Uncharacterized protein n=1 Tax=Holospora curviuscula TaxID=1082868 RepID=A0A2S5R9A9_9PROT|nr:hypothetical protein HCUR_00691 [Holospora curviuscula]